jgi:hypothetical protein
VDKKFALALAGAALIALLTGCARPVGDFGRAEVDPIHDELMPTLGAKRALKAGEPVSSFNLTDQEQEMRDRIWRYLVAPHAYDWFGDNVAELQRTRLVAPSAKPLKVDLYYLWLHGERFASSRTRYSRLGDDVRSDLDMLPSTFQSICAVLEIERERGVAADGLNLEDDFVRNAVARQAENHAAIDWFVRALANRYESYSYALDHLLVETPHEGAVAVNGQLSDLAIGVEAAERGDFCADPGKTHRAGAAIVLPRMLRDAPDEGPYRK